MKIIAIAYNYPAYNKTENPAFVIPEEPVVFSKADSALLKDGKPFFLPDFAEPCEAHVELVVRIGRLGKCIPERFALRYCDAVTVGISFVARRLFERCRAAGLPWELSTGFDGAAAVGRFLPADGLDLSDLRFRLDDRGGEVRRGWSGAMRWPVGKLIAHVSQFYTLRQGDLLFTGAPEAAYPVAIGQSLEGFLGSERLITIRVK